MLLACMALVALACAGCAALRAEGTARSLVADAADRHAYVTVTLRLTSDPVARSGRFGDYVVARGSVARIQWRGARAPTAGSVLVIGGEEWRQVPLGAVVRASGRLAPAESSDLAGVLTSRRAPELLREPGVAFNAAAGVRRAIREASAEAEPGARELVPGLVMGDDAGLPEEVVEEFRTAGLTHLTAVSGTNLTLVVGFLLALARWAGVRGRGLVAVGFLGVAGFVLLARAEPSVVRAAAMGSVALLALSAGGRDRAARGLSVAVLALLLFDPWLARSPGFALSVVATAGILFFAPPLRDALRRWLPQPIAEAVAVPCAAQLACTPIVAALSGSVSLVAVLANLLVAPVVGPATILGLLGGLTLLVLEPAGLALGRCAGWCAAWIVHVAHHAAALPLAETEWSSGVPALALLTLCCGLLALAAPRFAASGPRTVIACCLFVLVMVRPPLQPGWPPAGWMLVACDVGQGDGLVLNAGGGAAVVVDAGPEPAAIDRCLRRLRVREVPVVVLTHFHADHVDGLAGVLRGRRVREVLVTGLRDPPQGASEVDRLAARAGVATRVPVLGEVEQVGRLTWQVLGPVGRVSTGANDASLVLLVSTRGKRLLLSGDAEPEAQHRLARAIGPLQVDVLKVPHHGSRYQDADVLRALGARLAVVSAGQDNDYGHPAPETLRLLQDAGMKVARTDRDGDVAVVERGGDLRVVTTR